MILVSLSWTLFQIVLSFAMDKRSIRRIWLVGAMITALTIIVSILIRLTPWEISSKAFYSERVIRYGGSPDGHPDFLLKEY